MAATKDDAKLVVELAQWGAMIGLGDALGTIFDEGFDPETASANDEPVRIVLHFSETVGTLVKNDVLDKDLILDWLWVSGAWDRVGPAAVRARERFGVPALYENFEALANAQSD
jgi:hypothetical protein